MSTARYSNGIKINDTEHIKLIPPAATSDQLGGIKAESRTKEELKTLEKLEVVISTDDDKAYAIGTLVTTDTNGLMSAEDKTKLDGIEEGANNYTHPEAHPATMITQDTTHKFVTEDQITAWTAKADNTVATEEANGLMSAEMFNKLDGIEEGANNYVLPTASKDLGGVKTTSTVTNIDGYTASPIIDGVVYYKDTTDFGSMTGTLGIAHGGTGAATAADALKNLGLDATATELNYMGGVTSNVQTQLDSINSKLADLMYEEITFVSFSNNVGTVELGSTVNSVTLSWETSKKPSILTLDGTSISVDLTSHTYSNLALKPTSVTTKTYSITATDERGATASKNTTVSFVNGVYYGVISSGATVDSAAILKMSRKLQNSKSTTFTTTAGDGQYIVYALPSRLGTPGFNVGGFDGGFHLETSISFTNASGHTETYNVYFSDNLALGNTTVKVS